MHTPTLTELFPTLPFTVEADQFLSQIRQMSLLEQLKARRIGAVEIIPKLFSASLRLLEDGRFLIALNDVNTLEEYAEGIGHELGHTFHYDLSKTPPALRVPSSDEISDELFWLIEKFCDVFSERWLACADREKVERAAANQRKGIFARSYLLEEGA